MTPPLLRVVVPGGGHAAGRLELGALVHQQRGVTAVVEQHVRARSRPARSAPARCTTSTPPASRPSRRTPGCPCGLSGVPSGPTATAAAAWSWVEKMLQDAHRTCAPSATSVSISTAVWTVMCSEPVIRAPASGWLSAYSAAHRHQAGHLVLGQPDLAAAEVGQRQVGDLERNGLSGHAGSSVSSRRCSRQCHPRMACPAPSGATARPYGRKAVPMARAGPFSDKNL